MHAHRWTPRILAAAGLALLAGRAALAADVYTGTITGDAQKVAFTHGLAWLHSSNVVSVGLYQATPDAKERARAVAHGGNNFGVFAVPNVRFDLVFKEDARHADEASFDSCHILFAELAVGIYDLNAFADECGIVELRGDLRPGGVVHGKLKGKVEAYPRPDGSRPTYTWDVDFTATLIARP
jgi:hypothetical protein